ncbi:potassium transporter KefG [Chromatiales bacterium (ex Bugula neritina AB1)]|nr:potassium transporter KefG [Chromatiales bacterium (ex Bugula neritina AB1)]
MARVLVNYAHPGQRHSRVNSTLARRAALLDGITFVDLYSRYPRFNIDIDLEQQRLLEHDIIVLQFPIYWYSTPSLLKEWQDLVLEYGFAYGPGGDKLAGKSLLLAVTAGGAKSAYCTDGSNRCELRDLLSPLEQTAGLCKMNFLPPYVLYNAHQARGASEGLSHAHAYEELLSGLRDDRINFDAINGQADFGFAQLPALLEEYR